MQSQKRVLVITHGIPHPHRGASSVLFFWYVWALKSTGYTVLHLVLDTHRTGAEQELSDYKEAIETGPCFRVIRVALPVTHAFSYRKLAMEPALPSAHAVSEIKDFSPHATLCFDIVAAAVARKLGLANLLIWLGDLAYQTGLYHALYDVTTNPAKVLALPRVLLNCAVWKRFYRDTLDGQVNVIVASKSSEKLIDSLGARSKYLPYPWPGASSEREPQQKHIIPTFIMFGTLAALGSKSAFHFLLKKVYPLLTKHWGENGFQILIAGSREMPEWVKAEVVACPALKFLGFVDDLAALVDQCHAVLAPISVPVGNRSRIVTAMSMGSTVIAHKNTALGNPELVSGENCFLAGSAEDYAMYMRKVCESPAEAERIGRAARSTYLETFEPGVASQLLLRSLDLERAGKPANLS